MNTALIWSQLAKAVRSSRWLFPYGWQRLTRRARSPGTSHVIIALADHFEPSFLPDDPQGYADRSDQERRVERWCQEYPKLFERCRDADGIPFRHTYFYPAEQHDDALIDRLAEHCQSGWGELEIHLHHGRHAADTEERTRQQLVDFRDALALRGCLSRWEGLGSPRYAFVHGNWALGNSLGGRCCGVDGELAILAETGCYADLTLPSAPNPSQVAKINALYECVLPLGSRAPHRKGRDLRVGDPPRIFPLIVQGPLGMNFSRRLRGWPVPAIENAELSARNPPTMERLRLWLRSSITVKGRPDWIFVKLHCHGMDPRDESLMIGAGMRRFLEELSQWARESGKCRLHFVTARELVNIALAACDARGGDPGDYRDYRLRPIAADRRT